jgi:hypothetical protein
VAVSLETSAWQQQQQQQPSGVCCQVAVGLETSAWQQQQPAVKFHVSNDSRERALNLSGTVSWPQSGDQLRVSRDLQFDILQLSTCVTFNCAGMSFCCSCVFSVPASPSPSLALTEMRGLSMQDPRSKMQDPRSKIAYATHLPLPPPAWP